MKSLNPNSLDTLILSELIAVNDSPAILNSNLNLPFSIAGSKPSCSKPSC